MCRREAGAPATTAGVTASHERGSNCAQPQAAASHERGSDCAQPQAAASQPQAAADGAEILEFLTGVMRGTEEGSAQTMKAAELLGKRMGLFAERVEPPPAPVIVDDIGDDRHG